jgi:hypothetical protein
MSQQTIVTNLPKGFAGDRVGFTQTFTALSMENDTGSTRKQDRITVSTAANSTTYTFTIAGRSVSYTSDASATLQEIRDGLVAAANLDAIILQDAIIVAESGTTDQLLVTARSPSVDLAVAESDTNLALASVQAHVGTIEIPYGRAVVKGTADRSGILPTATGQTFVGVAERVHSDADPQDASVDAIKPLSTFTVVTKGTMLVEVENAVTAFASAFFVFSGVNAGKFRSDATGADAVPRGRYLTSGAAGSLVELELA